MKKTDNRKPLTLGALAKYNREVLLPAMSGVFLTKKDAFEILATKKDFEDFKKNAFKVFVSKQDLADFEERLEEKMADKFDEVNTGLDQIMSKLNRIDTELTVLSERESRIVKVLEIFFAILQRNGLMVPDDIQKITKQDILAVVNAK